MSGKTPHELIHPQLDMRQSREFEINQETIRKPGIKILKGKRIQIKEK